jgi:hypothetical protein
MNASSIRYVVSVFALLAISACQRREPTTWDADIMGPLAYGRLSLQQLIADSLLEADESGLWHLIFDEDLTDFDLDSIVEIPDTVILKEYPLLFGGAFPPGFALPILPTQQITIQHPSVQLKQVRMKSGQLRYRLQSPIDGYLNCSLNIPGLTLNGQPQNIVIQTSPPAEGQDFVAEGYIDLTGLELDLTGETGNSFNRISFSFVVVVDPNSGQSAQVAVGDEIVLELQFAEPKVSYATGYFGSHHYLLDEQVDFSGLASMPKGVLNLDGTSMQFLIRNAVGVDAQLDFDEITSFNANAQTTVALEHTTLFDPINITRAYNAGGNVQSVEYNFDVNASNSNLDLFLENLPSAFRLKGDVIINPLGNVSAGNDFIYTDEALEARLLMDVPLRFGMQNLSLSDTLLLTNSQQDVPLDGNLMLWVNNGFPVEAKVSLYVLENGARVTIAENLDLASAVPSTVAWSPTPAESWLEIDVNESLLAKMHEANPILIEVTLQTPGSLNPVGLYINQFIDFKLIVDGAYTIQYGE